MIIDVLRDGLFDHLPTIQWVTVKPTKRPFAERTDLKGHTHRKLSTLAWRVLKDIERNQKKGKA